MARVIEVEVTVMRLSNKAMLVSIDDDAGKTPREEWIPYSQIDEESEIQSSSLVGDSGTLAMTEWIAQQKGLT